LCLAHAVVVVSDEIWAPLTMPVLADDFVSVAEAPRGQFVPFASAREDGAFRQITVTCTSATKSFNLAALQDSAIIIENPLLRARYSKEIDAQGIFSGNFAGPHATEACYSEQGRVWLDAAILHIAGNMQFLRRALAFGVERVNSATPDTAPTYPLGIRANRPEGTYLVWLDCRELLARVERSGYKGLPNESTAPAAPAVQSNPLVDAFNKRLVEHTPMSSDHAGMMQMPRSLLLDFFSERCGVCFDDGEWFGGDGKGFVRINVATQRATLERVLASITAGVNAL
jgi:cystathionine beta-lyase